MYSIKLPEILAYGSIATVSLILLLMVLIPASSAGENTRASGNGDEIITTWRTNSTHYIDGKFKVPEGETLIIEPGVRVYFSYAGPSGGNPHTMRIYGKLVAVGEPDDPILFTSNATDPAANDWDKIKFHSSADDESIMEHCIVEYGIQGIQADKVDVTIRNNIIRNIGKYGIKVEGSSPIIENNTISSENIGIRITDEYGSGTPHPKIIGNTIDNNDFYGILIDSDSKAMIENNVIKNSGEYGIYTTVANPSITGNTFEDNTIGIAVVNSDCTLSGNVISRSSEYGILMKYGTDVDVLNNELRDNLVGMALYNTEGKLDNNQFTASTSKSLDMYDCDVALSGNRHEGMVRSSRHVTLKAVNSDGYPIKGTSVTVTDSAGTEVTTRALRDNSTVSINLTEYNIDAVGTKTLLFPYKVTVSRNAITTENIINDLSEALFPVTLDETFVPGITISSPGDIAVVDGKATILGSLDLDDLDTEEMDYKVMVRIDDGEWKEAISGDTRKWISIWDESEIEEGERVEVKLADGIRDPTVTQEIGIERENDGMIILSLLSIGIVIMIIILILAYAGRKKRTAKEEEEKEKSSEEELSP